MLEHPHRLFGVVRQGADTMIAFEGSAPLLAALIAVSA